MSTREARTLRPGRMRAGFDSMLEYANEGRDAGSAIGDRIGGLFD